MLYEKLKIRKKELGITTEQLSNLSGVPIGTINKILNGETRSPRYDTLSALEKILFENPEKSDYNPGNSLCESASAYNYNLRTSQKKQGEYTLDDYYALPPEHRAELIDGVLYDLAAPSFIHQQIITKLIVEIELYIRSGRGDCKVLPAPLDVQLNCDDRTILQPDIVVICDKKKQDKKGIIGAPDLCIEIVSDSSRKRDFGLKVNKYMNSGVREYWIVDPKHKKVVCYYFEADDYPAFYSFCDKIPVRIYDGKLEINLSDMMEDG